MSSAAAHCSACWSASATENASSSVSARSLLARSFIHQRLGEPSARGRPLGLRHLVGFEVVLEVNAGIERTVGLLRSVLHVDLRKRQAHGFSTLPVSAFGVHHRGDDYVVHLDDEELVLTF